MGHLEVIAVMALAAMGMWTAMGEGMILHKWTKVIERWPKALSYPLGACPRCMVTVFGTIAALGIGWDFDLLPWLAYVPCAVGLQELVQR